MKKLLIALLCMFCLTGVTVPAVAAYAEEQMMVETPSKPMVTNIVNSIRVRWTAVEGVEKYGLWRSETGRNGTYKWLGNPKQNSYKDEDVVSGKTYFYKVTCMIPGTNNHGAKSEAGGVAYVDTPDFTQRFNKAAGIVLQWDKIEGATGYGIYRKSFDGTDAWVRIGTVEGNDTFTYTDTEVKNNNGAIYRYTVRALAGSDRKTLSGCRNTGRTMVRLTSRVLNSAKALTSESVKCSWTTTAQATGYEVRFLVGSDVVKMFTIGNYKTGVKTFAELEPGMSYRVQVRSYKKVENVGGFYSAWSEAKSVTLSKYSMPEEALFIEKLPKDVEVYIMCGGVIITVKDDLYGALNYNGEEIVPNEYFGISQKPTEDGYFALDGKDGTIVFDCNGNVVKEITDGCNYIFIMGDLVAYSPAKYELYTYNLNTGEEKDLFRAFNDIGDFEVQPSGFLMAGNRLIAVAGLRSYSGTDDFVGKWEDVKAFQEITFDDVSYIGSMPMGDRCFYGNSNNGYFTYAPDSASGTLVGLVDMESRLPSFDAEGSVEKTFEAYMIDAAEVASIYMGIVPGDTFDSSNSSWQYGVSGRLYDGQYRHSIDKILNLTITDEEKGRRYFLVNFSDAILDENGCVTNVESVVKGMYDSLSLSPFGYHLAESDDQFFLVDDNGKKIGDYVDCSAFSGEGYAAVLKEDGVAYILDSNLREIPTGLEADYVSSVGDVLEINKDGNATYIGFVDFEK